MNFKYFLSICAMATVMTVSCGKMDSIDVDNASQSSLVQKSIPADAVSAEKVTFTATGEWHIAVSGADWVKVAPDHGDAGTYTLTITLDPNLDPEARSANIKIVCGEASQSISVTQMAAKISIFNQWIIGNADVNTGAGGQIECFSKSDVSGFDIKEEYLVKNESGEWKLNTTRNYYLVSGDEYGGTMKYENINANTGKDKGMTYTFSIEGNALTLTTSGNDGSWTNTLYLNRLKEPVTFIK